MSEVVRTHANMGESLWLCGVLHAGLADFNGKMEGNQERNRLSNPRGSQIGISIEE